MNTPPAKTNRATWLGLFIALFGILIIRWAIALVWSPYTFEATVVKESLSWLCVVALLLIIRRGEGLPFRSVHLGTAPIWKSILWALLLTLMCLIVGGAVGTATHFRGGEMGAALMKLPLWLVVLVTIRAGVAEELFYRGYAIERLQSMGLNRWLATVLPLLIFGFAHGVNGWQNVVVALALGAVLTGFYLWRRDLAANMIGHFLVDFIGVVLPRLLVHH